jgi:hypothetical protein
MNHKNHTHFNPEDGGSLFLQNVGTHLQDYTVSQFQSLQSGVTYILAYCLPGV